MLFQDHQNLFILPIKIMLVTTDLYCGVAGRFSTLWHRIRDLNLQPLGYQSTTHVHS